MQKEKELFSIESGFSKQKTEATKNDLSSKIQNDKLTIESKQLLLEEWLKIDDLQLQSELEKNKAFADFYNKNESDFQALQKMRYEDSMKEVELIEGTRRLQTSLFTFKKELHDADKKQKEDSIKAEKAKTEEEKKLSEERAKAWANEVWAKQQAEDEKIKANHKYNDEFAKQIEEEQELFNNKLDEQVDATIAAGEKIIEEKRRFNKS